MATEEEADEQIGQGLTLPGAPLVLPTFFIRPNLSLSLTNRLLRKKKSMQPGQH